jgi:catechol 2,3-dioxygenase-like lactoylglutathione lyase family enzyme
MKTLIAQILNRFESGKINRRQLIGSLTLAATSFGAGSALIGAQAPAPQRPAKTDAQIAKNAELKAAAKESPLKALQMSHIRYTTKDYKATRDFYQEVMGWMPVPGSDNSSQVKMAFYARNETPLGQPKGMPSAYVLIRNGWTAPPAPPPVPAGQQTPRPFLIDHFAFTVEFSQPLANGSPKWPVGTGGRDPKTCQVNKEGALERMHDILTKRGLNPSQDHDTSFHVRDNNGYDLQIAGIGMDGYTP